MGLMRYGHTYANFYKRQALMLELYGILIKE